MKALWLGDDYIVDANAPDLYFIRSADGPIKIGISRNVSHRLKALQTSSPHKLTLACVIRNAGAAYEAAYHQRFAAHRLHGEWFERCPEIEAEITRLTTPAREDRGA